MDSSRESATRAVAIEPHSSEAHYLLGRLAAEAAAQRGTFTPRDFHVHRHHMEAVLNDVPQHRHARYHALRVAFRAGDWSTALATAARGNPVPEVVATILSPDTRPTVASIGPLIDWSAQAADQTLPAEVWLCVYWRLIASHLVEEAFWAKDRYAECLIAAPAPHTLSATTERVRALASLRQWAPAGELVSNRSPLTADRRAALALARMRSDLELLTGDTTSHAGWTFPSLGNPASDERFAELVRDRHVAVVGPRRTERDTDRINDHDLVVVTKHLGRDTSSSWRTDVSYYADAAAQLSTQRIVESLDGGGLELAVFRPTSRRRLPESLALHPRVRISPAELSIGLEATPYAIPRILYDVLRHRPASITVFHADLFTDSMQYDDGYRGGGGGEPLEAVPGYGHDLRLDHRLMQTLWTHGHVRASEALEDVLALTESEYLRRVGDARRQGDRSAGA